MKHRIAYLTTEFPGQTHIFLWREYQALKELGLDIFLVATRRPPANIKSHTWSKEAEQQTSYLLPLSLGDYVWGFFDILKAGPGVWANISTSILKAEDVSISEKLRLLATAFVATKVVRLSQLEGGEHIHCTTCANAANLAMFASMLSVAPLSYSLSLLGPRLETYGSNQKNKWKYASFGLFQSIQLLKDARKKLAGNLPDRVAFAPVGVNLDTMRRENRYVPWQNSQVCRLYSCGRLNPVKGYKYVIEAVEILSKKGFDVSLEIAGEDEQGGTGYRKVVEQLIEEKELGKRIKLLGAVSEERNKQGYSNAHVYVMGSLDEAAGAVAAMEAMAMEVPVVMPDVGATSELIESGKDGLLVNPKESGELADAIEKVLRNPDLAIQLGANGRQKIAAKFHHRISAEVIAKFIRSDSTI
ncbi:glycosyltransferase family 4 protein [Lusitaniella coriacea LEGE 07157]|uniref:Glycosyltransferase family 4 protein n=1 Tax=Lusitaniella coriacea LEGE 07157 TaxID=945747 RepID=A0A8J7DVA8_9CYAN|nr:exopolysaccharide biosynthesis GT4 family glycosyltransferase EpsE [Lusitaniella coriacea]MBE9115672.1 glycosyltransferase family 4 protein [Lusitaniella coriacea LEGE 07157]